MNQKHNLSLNLKYLHLDFDGSYKYVSSVSIFDIIDRGGEKFHPLYRFVVPGLEYAVNFNHFTTEILFSKLIPVGTNQKPDPASGPKIKGGGNYLTFKLSYNW